MCCAVTRSCHSGENIAEAVISVVERIDVRKLGYFYINNNIINDVTIKIILNRFRPDIQQPQRRRVRYLGHIINLVAIAFLFSNDLVSLEAEISDISNPIELEA